MLRGVEVVYLISGQAANFNRTFLHFGLSLDLGGIMRSGTTWIGILGLFIMGIMLAYKSKLAFICGIGLVTIISWPRGTAVTYFPDTPAGDARFAYFSKVVDIAPLDKIVTPYTSDLANAGLALFTMLYVDFLDTSGTLLGLASGMGIIDEEGNFPKSRHAFAVDAVATMFGSIFGLSPVTSYIESGAGVEAGSKTGLTAVVCGFYFFISIFFAPIIASIPPWAIGGALIIVGALMARSLVKLKWHKVSHAISGFITVMMMPLTYSIAYGLIAGIFSFVIMEGTFLLLNKAFGIAIPDKSETPPALSASVIANPAGAAEVKAVTKHEDDEGESDEISDQEKDEQGSSEEPI